MNILQVHNHYQIAGGEDTVVQAEKKLLEENGHQVHQYLKHNDEIKTYSKKRQLSLIRSTTWSQKTYEEVSDLIKSNEFDLCHVHNFFPLISPSVFKACKDAGLPVVMTLHNYRLICSNGLFFRSGDICEECLERSAYQAIKKSCYRDSKVQTYAVARMIEKNKKWDSWNQNVDAFICLSDFAKSKFEQFGIDASKLKVKPNFIQQEPIAASHDAPYFLFVGRLTEEKGIRLIIEVAGQSKWPIKIVGEGPLEKELEETENVELIGKKTHHETLKYIKNAKALLLPSLWYEGMPMTIIEAFSQSTPVIASNLGAMQSMVDDGENGLLFEKGNITDFYKMLNYFAENEQKCIEFGENALKKFQNCYSSESNLNLLEAIYHQLLELNK